MCLAGFTIVLKQGWKQLWGNFTNGTFDARNMPDGNSTYQQPQFFYITGIGGADL